ncbi:hypothetical protein HYH03_003728 [Edaphochlamys debaryana]|uniref:Uncharacterized protein n=1 Tax=Edaphochlamys debaryana TaxID=47281 RepID=A0A836C372_9CHLO|nr:hypothetical protein HYH03_003728 [Edaphochlamys debaryana]|eukprot:KAG2498475.1 hypothetical protein HYH03_003728 [Edaphochlamys debaryana]
MLILPPAPTSPRAKKEPRQELDSLPDEGEVEEAGEEYEDEEYEDEEYEDEEYEVEEYEDEEYEGEYGHHNLYGNLYGNVDNDDGVSYGPGEGEACGRGGGAHEQADEEAGTTRLSLVEQAPPASSSACEQQAAARSSPGYGRGRDGQAGLLGGAEAGGRSRLAAACSPVPPPLSGSDAAPSGPVGACSEAEAEAATVVAAEEPPVLTGKRYECRWFG